MIQVGIITGDWLLDGHVELSTCTEPGCPDWHTLTIYRHGAEVLTVALSPDQDRELEAVSFDQATLAMSLAL